MLVLIVGSDLRRYVRQEMLTADVEFGLMPVAALDAIHAGELDGHEWSSRVLHDDSTLCLNNHGREWTLILNLPRTTQKLCLPDGTSKTKKQRLPDEMVAGSEETEAPGKSVEKGSAMTKVLVLEICFQTCDESYRFLLHDWRCDWMRRAARQAAKL